MTWQKILAQGFSSSEELLQFLSLPVELASSQAEKPFKTRLPRGFALRMEKANANDPLLKQVLATSEELQVTQGYSEDPLQETRSNPLQGLLHKYHGRVLLTFTGACAINCRYCFRRHFPYTDNNPGRKGWNEVLQYIESDSTIHEVILSGGDPLLASDAALSDFIRQLEQIKHIKTLRFHSRFPIVLPERIDDSFLALLQNTQLNKVMVMHCNHAQELDEQVKRACEDLRQVNCHLLNQTVLLKGINDEASILCELSERLFQFGIFPYYLHVLDKVAGAAHFDLPLAVAKKLHQQMQNQLPGYLVPKLVREQAGEKHKVLI